MKILQINSVYGYGSTGKIVQSIHEDCLKEGIDAYAIFGRKMAFGTKQGKAVSFDSTRVFDMSSPLETDLDLIGSVFFDKAGLYSKSNTKRIIKKIQEINPDVIHLHNIHGFYLNYPILFSFLKEYNKPTIWTLHDCWSFTGYCSHYEYNNCYQWKTGCTHCKFRNVYPYRVFSNASNNYKKKASTYNLLDSMHLVTPSNWLKEQVACSFLKSYPCSVIHNGIDTKTFSYRESTILTNYGLEGKKIALAVSSVWTKQKGFDEYIKLAKLLDESWRIVMVGVSHNQSKMLPKNIIGIERTSDMDELVKWYSASTCYLNLTLEDTYPTVNLEAISCGLPVVTYKTGGSTEIVLDGNGYVVENKKIENVIYILNTESFDRLHTVVKNEMTKQYIDLYKEVYHD